MAEYLVRRAFIHKNDNKPRDVTFYKFVDFIHFSWRREMREHSKLANIIPQWIHKLMSMGYFPYIKTR